ncbi:unannotated protein [freshwater metagenome]|uniref:Unannotated protein n=1 Tax=freshwater metagenome TaxID=449393 RepID=A0A6J7EYP6_9ZZZZ
MITGAGSGIGRAAAELFVSRGCQVVAVDVNAEALEWAADNVQVICVAGDVSAASTNTAMVDAALHTWGRLDIAVLNAGTVGGPGFEADGAIERFDRLLAVNLRSVALGIRHCAPAIRLTGADGAIVATASTSGMGGDPGNWAYNASKAGVINLVRAAAIDYAVQGIRINAVAPGPTETGMTQGLRGLPELHRAMARRVPMQRWGEPCELAEAIWFLASPAASFITGVTLPVDGGLSASAGHFDLPSAP